MCGSVRQAQRHPGDRHQKVSRECAQSGKQRVGTCGQVDIFEIDIQSIAGEKLLLVRQDVANALQRGGDAHRLVRVLFQVAVQLLADRLFAIAIRMGCGCSRVDLPIKRPGLQNGGVNIQLASGERRLLARILDVGEEVVALLASRVETHYPHD